MFLRRDFLHVGPIRDDILLNEILQLAAGRSGRGAAPVAIAAGEFSHVADLWGSHHSSAIFSYYAEVALLGAPFKEQATSASSCFPISTFSHGFSRS